VLVDGLLDDPHPDPRKTRDYLELIAAENARLTRLVDAFLTFARLDRGVVRVELGEIDPAAVVHGAVASVRPRLTDPAALRVDVPQGLPPVLGDADALRSALVNLIDNALKYTAAEKRIVVRARVDGDAHVRFEVHRQRHRGAPARAAADLPVVLPGRFAVVGPCHGGGPWPEHRRGGDARAHRAYRVGGQCPGGGSTFALRVPCPPRGVAA
jgi:hypothetical protein